VLAPVPPDVLRQLAQGSLRVIPGARDYHALVDDEPGDMMWAEELATRLSASHRGKHYAFGIYKDEYFHLTIAQDGRVLSSDEGAIDHIARELGCPVMPEPFSSRRGVSNFLVVEGATPDEVAPAIGIEPAPRRHLEPSALGTIGWVDGGDLGIAAGKVSRQLGRRAYAITDEPDQLYLQIFEGGKEVGFFEESPTPWGDRCRVASVLGEATPDGIRKKLGLPARG
jgi:hypothetical protein